MEINGKEYDIATATEIHKYNYSADSWEGLYQTPAGEYFVAGRDSVDRYSSDLKRKTRDGIIIMPATIPFIKKWCEMYVRDHELYKKIMDLKG